mgnify:CR=1 FL=1
MAGETSLARNPGMPFSPAGNAGPGFTSVTIADFAAQAVVCAELTDRLGVIDAPIQMLFTEFSILVGMVYVYLPLMVLPLYAAIERFDFRLVEAGYDLYANRWQVLRRVILPIVRPGIVAGSILVFVPSLGAFLAPDLLGGAKTFMIGSLIDEQFRGSQGNWRRVLSSTLGQGASLFGPEAQRG